MVTYSKIEPLEGFKSKTRAEMSLVLMKCTESSRCGCYKGKCWGYIDDKQMPKTDSWCFT